MSHLYSLTKLVTSEDGDDGLIRIPYSRLFAF